MSTLIRIIVLQSLWYLFIKLGDHNLSWTFPLLALAYTALDKYFFIKEMSWNIYFRFTLFLFVSGLIIDSLVLQFGLIQFAGWYALSSPPFLWAIWIIFLPYYPIAFKKFYGEYALAAICGAIFAPISYYSGSKIGNLILTTKWTLAVISLMWAIFFPTSVLIYRKFTRQ